MTDLLSNRDLYCAIRELGESRRTSSRSLEVYLLAVFRLAEQYRDRNAISLSEFFHILALAFDSTPAAFNDSWRDIYNELDIEANGYEGWNAEIIQQLVDLREMDEDGSLANEEKYFGITSSGGSSWYNFDPATYLECATAGAVGGDGPDDRIEVPGDVLTQDAHGEFQVVSPGEISNPEVAIPLVTWDIFHRFVICGRIYE